MQANEPKTLICPVCSRKVAAPPNPEIPVECPQCHTSIRQTLQEKADPIPVTAEIDRETPLPSQNADVGASQSDQTLSDEPVYSPRQRRSPVGTLVSVALGGLTVYGVFYLLPNQPIEIRLSDPKPEIFEPPPADENSSSNGGVTDSEILNPEFAKEPKTVPVTVPAIGKSEKNPTEPVKTPPDPEQLEKDAANRLRLAEILLKNKSPKARQRLEEIAQEYPGTEAAKKALAYLRGL